MSREDRQQQIQTGIHHLSSHDPRLANAIEETGVIFSVEPHDRYYEALVRAIISQQLSVAAANTIEMRLRQLFVGDTFTAQELLKLSDEELKSVGISRNKVTYLKDLASHIDSGEIMVHDFSTASDEAVVASLTAVKGIGVWTAQMFLIFCLGRLNVLPSADLGIQVGIQQTYELNERPTPKQVEELANNNTWYPYASIASWYLWKNKE